MFCRCWDIVDVALNVNNYFMNVKLSDFCLEMRNKCVKNSSKEAASCRLYWRGISFGRFV